jgi:CDGSH iron-sulfur domain-containing protein 3
MQKMEETKSVKSKTIIEVIDSGPLKISGNFIIKDLKRYKETTMAEILLCRCGKSSDKPFCDGSHKNK